MTDEFGEFVNSKTDEILSRAFDVFPSRNARRYSSREEFVLDYRDSENRHSASFDEEFLYSYSLDRSSAEVISCDNRLSLLSRTR
jgi:hypothetical protein